MEGGNVLRQRVGKDLVDLFIAGRIAAKGPFKRMSFDPTPPFSLELNPDDLSLVNRFAAPIGLFVNHEMRAFSDPKLGHGVFRIFVAGEPRFSGQGVVTF